ncbi:Chaperone protein DnaJ [Bienertia sinuspersici]
MLLSKFQTSQATSASDNQQRIASVESRFSYAKAIPEQKIDGPVGLSVTEKEIGDEPRCGDCQAKGAVLCATCCGSGLYVDSILECQGIIVKVRCLSCGGTGNIMCSECGGRGHL